MSNTNDEFYGMFSYINAHGRAGGNNTEWRWCGPYDTRAEALATTKRIQKNGKSRNWYEFCDGQVKVVKGKDLFVKKANAVGLSPKVD